MGSGVYVLFRSAVAKGVDSSKFVYAEGLGVDRIFEEIVGLSGKSALAMGIGNIGDIQVNKKVDAYIEMVERGSGDIFDIYLKVDRNTWYYIAYSPGGLQVLSSNRTFNNIVYDLKASDRRVRAKLGEAQYIYSLAAQRRLELFLDRFTSYEEGDENVVF